MTRVAIYARYLSDMQSEASIDDQVRICKAMADKRRLAGHPDLCQLRNLSCVYHQPPWRIETHCWRKTRRGRSRPRRGAGQFSRDQEDMAAIFMRIRFCGAKLFTISEGEITELHIRLKGKMNALFFKDLGAKVRRGVRGRLKPANPAAASPMDTMSSDGSIRIPTNMRAANARSTKHRQRSYGGSSKATWPVFRPAQ